MKHLVRAAALMVALGATALPVAAQDFYRLATLAPGSSPYMVMSTFAQIVNDRLKDTEIQVNATGVATAHAMEAANGQLDFFMMAPIVHNLMMRGEAMYQQIPDAPEMAENLRSVFIFPLGLYHIVTYADSGIDDLGDLEGKRVYLGPPGGSARVTMQRLVEAVTGLKPGEDFTAVDLGWDAAAQAFQDGRIDVYANPTIPPSPVIQQMALGRDIRLLGLTEEQLAQPGAAELIEREGGMSGTIPAGTYGARQVNEEDVRTIGANVGVGTAVHVPEDAVYEITKAFWEGVEEQREGTPWLRNVTLEQAFTDLNMPLHPGALRYYEEIGLEIPEGLRPPE